MPSIVSHEVVRTRGARLRRWLHARPREGCRAGRNGRLRPTPFSRRKNFSVYFACVEAITTGCHSIAPVCMTKSDYASLETKLHRRAYELGLASLPYPQGFRGMCAAIRPQGFVVVPNGDIHKCWDTVSTPRLRIGTLFDLESVKTDQRMLSWLRWTPFENKSCRACRLLPSCGGTCAHKFVNSDQTRGEAASLPCPSWKYDIKQRLLMIAQQSGDVRPEDYDPADAVTFPDEMQIAVPAGAPTDLEMREDACVLS